MVSGVRKKVKATNVEYRIVKQMKAKTWYKGRGGQYVHRFVNVGEKQVIWRGKSMRTLAKNYPRYRLMDERHDDPLRLMEEGCSSGFVAVVYFERLTKRGWRACVDPRPRLPVDKKPEMAAVCG